MVIDDSNTIRRSAEIFLLQAGCTVILAEDGFDALCKITDHQPDMIFVDIMMPRLDGLGLAKILRKSPALERLPILFLTAKGGTLDMVAGINAGARHYVTKPFKVADVIAKVRAMTRPK
jgi:twitching motility two-component system response regulator PilG